MVVEAVVEAVEVVEVVVGMVVGCILVEVLVEGTVVMCMVEGSNRRCIDIVVGKSIAVVVDAHSVLSSTSGRTLVGKVEVVVEVEVEVLVELVGQLRLLLLEVLEVLEVRVVQRGRLVADTVETCTAVVAALVEVVAVAVVGMVGQGKGAVDIRGTCMASGGGGRSAQRASPWRARIPYLHTWGEA